MQVVTPLGEVLERAVADIGGPQVESVQVRTVLRETATRAAGAETRAHVRRRVLGYRPSGTAVNTGDNIHMTSISRFQ